MKVALLALALALPPGLRAPDLHVTAVTASGADAPELASAVSRALVATGTTVHVGARANEGCGAQCVKLLVREERSGRFRIEARQQEHFASATLEVAGGASAFEQARAVAVQARLLITWPSTAPEKPAVTEARDAKPVRPPARIARVAPAPEQDVVAPAPASVAPPAQPAVEDPPLLAAADAPVTDAVPAQHPPPEIELPRHPVEPLRLAVDAPVAPPPRSANTWAWAPTVAGAGAAVAAGAFALAARDRYSALDSRTVAFEHAAQYRDQGKRYQTASLILSGGAVAGLAVGIAGLLAGPSEPEPVSVGVAPLPGGGGVVGVSGSTP